MPQVSCLRPEFVDLVGIGENRLRFDDLAVDEQDGVTVLSFVTTNDVRRRLS